jgi:hypothetical protein
MIKEIWKKYNRRHNRIIAKIALAIIIFIFIFLAGFYFIFYKVMSDESRVSFLRSRPLLVKMLPVIRSVRKVSDIQHFIYFFQKSDLPVYELEIKDDNFKKMLDSLPEGFTEEIYTNKIYVPAKATYNNREYKVKVRFRGDNSIHWEADKKSYLIKFDSEDPLEGGVRRLSFIIPDDRKFAVEHFNNYRAEKLGLMYPNSDFAILKINGKDYGPYFLIENWSEEMLAKWEVPDVSNFYGGTDPVVWFNKVVFDEIWENLGMWEKMQSDDKFNFDHYSEVYKLLDLVNNASDEEFNESIFYLIDKDNFFNWVVHQNLSSSTHQAGANLRMFFNNAVGKFYFIPWDVDNFPVIENIDTFYSQLVSRVLSNPEYTHERNKRLWNYVGNKDNLEEDLKEYDKIYNDIKVAIYKDRTKIYTNKWADNLYEDRRSFIIDNFNYLRESLKEARVVSEVIIGGNNLVTFDVKTDNLSVIILDNFEFEFMNDDFSFNGYKLFYDINRNNIFDNNDRKVTENYKPLLYTKRKILNQIGENYELELTSHRFFLVGDSVEKKDFIENLIDVKFKFSNAVTGKKVDKDNITVRIVNNNVFKNFNNIDNIDKFISANKFFKVNKNTKEITLSPGLYNIDNNVFVPKGYRLTIQPGAQLAFAPDVSLVSYSSVVAIGTVLNPIIFKAQDRNRPWGNFLILSNKEENIFKHCSFEYGGESYINGAYASGMLALHDTGNIIIEDSIFRYATGDDALNIKWSKAEIKNNIFEKNGFDAIDLDWGDNGIIEGNKFIDNGNDSMDIGGGDDIIIKNNLVLNSGDKCISVGENAQKMIIYNNILKDCVVGVAIKDKSNVKIINNTIINNETGLSLYQKKPVWSGSKTEVYNTIIWGGDTLVSIDEKSEIKIENSNIMNGYEGQNNVNIKPEFNEEFKLLNEIIKGDKKYLNELNIEVDSSEIPLGIFNYD